MSNNIKLQKAWKIYIEFSHLQPQHLCADFSKQRARLWRTGTSSRLPRPGRRRSYRLLRTGKFRELLRNRQHGWLEIRKKLLYTRYVNVVDIHAYHAWLILVFHIRVATYLYHKYIVLVGSYHTQNRVDNCVRIKLCRCGVFTGIRAGALPILGKF